MTPAYDRELIARMLEEYRAKLPAAASSYSTFAITDQIKALREADNAEVASVETVNSRSRLRRIAAERGEPAPRFDASEDGLLPEAAAAWLESHISVLRHDGFAATADVLGRIVALIRRLAASGQGVEGWMRDRKQVEELASHLENVGWAQDERGDVQCMDQGAAMAAEVVRKVLLPMIPAAPTQEKA